jgi:PAS domain S-box-containing protein
MASSIPFSEVADLHRWMTEEIREVAIFFMDPDGIITVWNRAAEDMKGYPAEEAIGQHLSMLYTDQDQARGWPEHNLGEARKNGFYREEQWRKKKDGSLFWARITLTALRDETGTLAGFSKITLDLTEHKLLEQCVKERDETNRILQAVNAGTWSWHPETDQIELSPNLLGLLGYDDTSRTMSFARWCELVHPRDRSQVEEKFRLARAHLPGTSILMEICMRRKEGHYRWFFVRADWYREKESQPYALSGVNVDIHERKITEEELREAVDKLKEADARKDEFLAMLAHELRNPLAPIRAAADLLRMKQYDIASVRQATGIIGRQVNHMTTLVDDLLDVSRVTRGLVKLEKTPLEIRHIIADAVEQVTPLIRAKGHRLTLHLAPDAASVFGNHKRLVQVLANILNNAAKYTGQNGEITLRTQVHAQTVLLHVCDNGIGMAPSLVARVFELFVQGDRGADRSSGGLGIGLALAKSLIELHEGYVHAESEGENLGSKFTICLPRFHERRQEERGISPGQDLSAPAAGLSTMVVDDNEDAATMLSMLLEAMGHRVHVEHSAAGAIERARKTPLDVCLLDIGLPETDGYELARQFRASPATSEALLVAVTGYGMPDDRKKAFAAGFDHHLVKPVDMASLSALLDGRRERRGDAPE